MCLSTLNSNHITKLSALAPVDSDKHFWPTIDWRRRQTLGAKKLPFFLSFEKGKPFSGTAFKGSLKVFKGFRRAYAKYGKYGSRFVLQGEELFLSFLVFSFLFLPPILIPYSDYSATLGDVYSLPRVKIGVRIFQKCAHYCHPFTPVILDMWGRKGEGVGGGWFSTVPNVTQEKSVGSKNGKRDNLLNSIIPDHFAVSVVRVSINASPTDQRKIESAVKITH